MLTIRDSNTDDIEVIYNGIAYDKQAIEKMLGGVLSEGNTRFTPTESKNFVIYNAEGLANLIYDKVEKC